MRLFLYATVALLALPCTSTPAQQAGLKIGDPAPALQVGKWVQGTPTAEFTPGKVTIVEFWATWCGPCIAGMPHLSDVQDRYAKTGLRVIGVTKPDDHNVLADVEAMVQDKQDVMRYTVMWDAEGATFRAFMTASGQTGIPTCFVVDGAGRVAWIGHPFFLEFVLPAVLDGSWNLSKSPEEVKARIADYRALSQSAAARLSGKAAEELLERIDAYCAANAAFAGDFEAPRYHLLVGAGRHEEAHLQGLRVADGWRKAGDAGQLNSLAWSIVNPEAKLEQRDLALALYAATCAVQIGHWKDPYALDTLARAHWTMGDRARDRSAESGSSRRGSGRRRLSRPARRGEPPPQRVRRRQALSRVRAGRRAGRP